MFGFDFDLLSIDEDEEEEDVHEDIGWVSKKEVAHDAQAVLVRVLTRQEQTGGLGNPKPQPAP